MNMTSIVTNYIHLLEPDAGASGILEFSKLEGKTAKGVIPLSIEDQVNLLYTQFVTPDPNSPWYLYYTSILEQNPGELAEKLLAYNISQLIVFRRETLMLAQDNRFLKDVEANIILSNLQKQETTLLRAYFAMNSEVDLRRIFERMYTCGIAKNPDSQDASWTNHAMVTRLVAVLFPAEKIVLTDLEKEFESFDFNEVKEFEVMMYAVLNILAYLVAIYDLNYSAEQSAFDLGELNIYLFIKWFLLDMERKFFYQNNTKYASGELNYEDSVPSNSDNRKQINC